MPDTDTDLNMSLSNMEKRRYELMLSKADQELQTLKWQLSLSDSFSKLLLKAYDALRSYGVDYRKLRTYDKWDGITWFKGADNVMARESMTRWITEISHDIDAAVRRKSIKEVPLNEP